jgi:glycosyltransferase involved in cell wall biosynthesis
MGIFVGELTKGNNMKIALAVIVRGVDEEAKLLDKCLENVSKHVDGIFIDVNAPGGKRVSNKVITAAKKYGADVKKTVWKNNFVQARNDNFARIPDDYDFILWLDSDDTVENPEKIKEVCAIIQKNIDGLYVKYDYAHDSYGNVTVSHWVARIVRNNSSFAWKSSFNDAEVTVHETLNERRKVGKVMNEEFWIKHNSTDARMDASLARNIELLEGMLAKYPKNVAPDPRVLYYLATHYVDAQRLLEAKDLFEYYLTLSGWAEERSQAWVYLGMIYMAMQDKDKARGCYMRGMAENPNDPNPYVELGELEIEDGLFLKAVQWLDMAVSKKLDPTSSVQRPMDSTYRAYRLLAQAHVNIGGKSLQKAQKWLTEARKLRPFEPDLDSAQEVLDELVEIRNLTKATNTILNKLRTSEETNKVVDFTNALPSSLQENPLVVSARNYYREPKIWPKKSIAILCGWGPLGNWGPKSLEKGLGGSEEAVIRISRELAKQGYDVTVFGTPGEEAGSDLYVGWNHKYPSVQYKHYWEFSRKDTFDIFISWRNPEFFDEPVNARKSYLWLHDVMDKEEFIPERLDNVDRIIFVSQYHRDLYPFIDEKKCLVSGNGISPEDFVEIDGKFERDPYRIIYMSSHVRGLEMIYRVWDDVKKEVPQAKLDVYYGWGSYDTVNRNNPERMAWKEKMVKYEQELEDVTDHGKIGHKQINEEIFKSGVWAYPCPFPEVYCISAVKAQAGGAVPVSSSFAALDETVQYGVKLPMKAQDENTPVGQWDKGELDQFKKELINMLKDAERQESIRPEMMKWARENMSWAKTAEGWIEDFNQ